MKKYNNNELQDHKNGQKIMTDMLRVFIDICKKNNIQYWCCGGTLIGTVRTKGWIPHDGDIDVAMIESDYLILRDILIKQLPNRYWLQDNLTDNNYKVPVRKIRYLDAVYDDKCKKFHKGLQLDILTYARYNDYLLPHYIDYELKPIKSNMIFPLKTLSFEGMDVLVPNEYEKYVCNVWGACPPPELDETEQYPHEGKISFIVPNWIIKKYKHLYP